MIEAVVLALTGVTVLNGIFAIVVGAKVNALQSRVERLEHNGG